MSQYRMSNKYFLALIFSIVFNIILLVWINGIVSKLVLFVALLVMVYGFIEKAFKRYITNESGIVVKTMTKENIHLYWSEVRKIEKIPSRKNTFKITAESKTFYIAPNLERYGQLLTESIEYCENNESIIIEI